MKPEQESLVAAIPMRKVGPVKLSGPEAELEAMVPLATFETPLWPSVERGARVTAQAGGIRAVVFDERLGQDDVGDPRGRDLGGGVGVDVAGLAGGVVGEFAHGPTVWRPLTPAGRKRRAFWVARRSAQPRRA